MRVIASAILLCLLLQACGSKGALVLPPKPGSAPAGEQQQSDSSKQK
jgi:predicted small lipoprotein YifL